MRITGRTQIALLLALLGILLISLYNSIIFYQNNASNVQKADNAKVDNSNIKFDEVVEVAANESIKVKYRTISKNNARKVVQVKKNSPVISSARAIKAAKRLLPDYATIKEANLVIITNPKPRGLLWQIVFESFTGYPESDSLHYASVIYLDPLTGKEHKF